MSCLRRFVCWGKNETGTTFLREMFLWGYSEAFCQSTFISSIWISNMIALSLFPLKILFICSPSYLYKFLPLNFVMLAKWLLATSNWWQILTERKIKRLTNPSLSTTNFVLSLILNCKLKKLLERRSVEFSIF